MEAVIEFRIIIELTDDENESTALILAEDIKDTINDNYKNIKDITYEIKR